MAEVSVEFIGIPGGDGECFCYFVTLEELHKVCKITGWDCTRDSEIYRMPGMYRAYPGNELPDSDPPNTGKPMKVKMTTSNDDGRFRCLIEAEPYE